MRIRETLDRILRRVMNGWLGRMAENVLVVGVIVDMKTLDFVQTYIADPLQTRGLTLLSQYRITNWVVGISQMSRPDGWFSIVIQLIVLAFWIQRGLWPSQTAVRFLSLDPDSDAVTRNPFRYYAAALLVRLWFLIMTTILAILDGVFAHPDGILAALAALTLMSYIEACDPKPPRPKKIRARAPVPVEV